MSDYSMKDSGEREEFSTGAVRDTQNGKGRYDLLPVVALERVAKVYQRGAEKYDERNWMKGMPLSRFMDSALRHLMQYAEGRRDEDHLAQAAFNVLGLIHTEEMIRRDLLPARLEDLPSYVKSVPPSPKGTLERIEGHPDGYVFEYRPQTIDEILPKRQCDDNHYAHPAHTYTKISAASNAGSIRYRCPGASFDRT